MSRCPRGEEDTALACSRIFSLARVPYMKVQTGVVLPLDGPDSMDFYTIDSSVACPWATVSSSVLAPSYSGS